MKVKLSILVLVFFSLHQIISFSQTSHDIKLPVGGNFNFVIDEYENLHVSWGSPISAIYYGVFTSSGELIKQFKIPNTSGDCKESNLILKNDNIVLVWTYADLVISEIFGQIFSSNQDTVNSKSYIFNAESDATTYNNSVRFFK